MPTNKIVAINCEKMLAHQNMCERTPIFFHMVVKSNMPLAIILLCTLQITTWFPPSPFNQPFRQHAQKPRPFQDGVCQFLNFLSTSPFQQDDDIGALGGHIRAQAPAERVRP